MPIYEYVCLECDEKFAMLQSLYPPEQQTECPKCSSTDVKKVMSSFSCSSSENSAAPAGPPPRFAGGG